MAVEIGKFHLHLLRTGTFRLDGGAMFGVVPQPVWEKKAPADDRNRILLAMNCLLVEAGDDLVVIDTGMGNKSSMEEFDIYDNDPNHTVVEAVREAGFDPADITIVVNSHLHLDHAGGNTQQCGGNVIPSFPTARYFVHEGELEDAEHGNERTRGSYRVDDWVPLRERGMLEVVGDGAQIIPGIRYLPTPGHTRCHQSVMIEDGGKAAIFLADLVPTTAHLRLPWIMAYDLYPMTTLETKRRVLDEVVKRGWLCMFEHDPNTPLGRLTSPKTGRYELEPLTAPAG